MEASASSSSRPLRARRPTAAAAASPVRGLASSGASGTWRADTEPAKPALARPQLRSPSDLALIPAAPEFRPTAEEWADPYKFIESIRTIGEQAGVIKVIPPAGWKPPFAVDVEHFKFHTRLQKINQLEGQSRSQMNYMDGLLTFWQNQGQPLTRQVQLDHKPVDFFVLKKEVERLGGPTKVTEQQRWLEVGKFMGFSKKTCTSLSTSIRKIYFKYIHPYDVYLKSTSGIAAATPAVQATSQPAAPSRMGRMSAGGSGASAAVAAYNSSLSATNAADIPSPAGSDQDTMQVDQPSPGAPAAAATSTPIRARPHVDEVACDICKNPGGDERMLLCDSCDHGYHMDCLSPPITVVPKNNWYCPHCLEKPDTEYGFEDGRLHTIESYKKQADAFKEQYFAKRENPNPSEDDIEREFWRLIEAVQENVEVEYGADIHTSKRGSGFPSIERDATNPYASCPWNINNLPVLANSVFSHITKSDISGMMVPWMYVGMVFSAFCWHNEDHYTYSINYMHAGDTKTWYGIPGPSAEGFEQTMRAAVPELFEAQPDLLFQLVTMLDPRRMLENNVKVVKCHQHANEFVITFPQAYHAGFNQGFNINEAVNFASLDWFEYGYNCIKRYREFNKAPCFSHDELIYNLMTTDKSIPTAIKMKDSVVRMHDEEVTIRERLRLKGVEWEEMTEREMQDELSCSVCQTLCFLSTVHSVDTKKMFCMHHALELLDNPEVDPASLVLHIRFSRDHLRQFTDDVKKRANIPVEWSNRLKDLLSRHRRPPLQRLQAMFVEKKERIPVHIPEADHLAVFLDRANQWVDRAARVLARKPKKRNLAAPEPKPTLAQVEQMCAESETLPFDAPEIQDLRLLAKSVHVFRDRARKAINTEGPISPSVLEEIRSVLEQGLSLDVDVAELQQLQRVIDETVWSDRVTREITDVADYSVFEVLFAQASHLALPLAHPLCVKLVQLQNKASAWNQQAEAVFSQPKLAPRLDELKQLYEDGKPMMISRALHARLHRHIANLEQWANDCKFYTSEVNEALAKYHTNLSALPKPSLKATSTVAESTEALSTPATTPGLLTHPTTVHDSEEDSPAPISVDTSSKADATDKVPIKPEVNESASSSSSAAASFIATAPRIAHLPTSLSAAKEQRDVGEFILKLVSVEDPRKSTEDIKGIIETGRSAHGTVTQEIKSLKQILDAAESWVVRGRNLFYRRGQVSSFDEGLRELVAHTKTILLPRDAKEDSAESKVYCLCRQREGGMMIECECCKEWFHGKCIGVSKKLATTTKDYLCPLCDQSKLVPHATSSPEMIVCLAWLRDAVKLSVVPPVELKLAIELFALIHEWQLKVNAAIQAPNVDLKVLDVFLRQALLLEVSTPELHLIRETKQQTIVSDWLTRARVILRGGYDMKLQIKDFRQIIKEATLSGVPACDELTQLRNLLHEHKVNKWIRDATAALVNSDTGPPQIEELLRKGTQDLHLPRTHQQMVKLNLRLDEFERAAWAAQAMLSNSQNRVVNLSALTALAGVLPPVTASMISKANSPNEPTQQQEPAPLQQQLGLPTAYTSGTLNLPSVTAMAFAAPPALADTLQSSPVISSYSSSPMPQSQKRSGDSENGPHGNVAAAAPANPAKRRRPSSGARRDRSRSAAGDEPKDESYCLCRAPAGDLTMLACDGCDEWFHLYCIDVKEEDANRIEYECPKCALRNRRTYKYGKPAPGVKPPLDVLYSFSGIPSVVPKNAISSVPPPTMANSGRRSSSMASAKTKTPATPTSLEVAPPQAPEAPVPSPVRDAPSTLANKDDQVLPHATVPIGVDKDGMDVDTSSPLLDDDEDADKVVLMESS